MTLRQLRGFLGITGYCCILILGYGELAGLLYKLLTETQQAQTSWFGPQRIRRLLRLYKLLPCRLLICACPQDQSPVCYRKKAMARCLRVIATIVC